jgi:hypothetical protein
MCIATLPGLDSKYASKRAGGSTYVPTLTHRRNISCAIPKSFPSTEEGKSPIFGSGSLSVNVAIGITYLFLRERKFRCGSFDRVG